MSPSVGSSHPRSPLGTVDPGFTERAGGLIWKLMYDDDMETADGRFQASDRARSAPPSVLAIRGDTGSGDAL